MNAKRLLALFLSMLMLLCVMSLAGCQDAPEPEVPEEPDTPDTPDNPDNPDNPSGPEELPALTLVSEGVSEYVIVRGENASPFEVTASTELQKYLKQISGAELAIVTDSTAAVEKEIVVGKTNRESDGEFDREKLGKDGFVIKTSDSKLYLVGGEKRGTLYSVYEFLEAYLGCRFFTPTVETVPTLTTITIDGIKKDLQIPEFDYRSLCGYRNGPAEFAAKRKIEYRHFEPFAGSFVHSFSAFCNPNVYYDEHPEYFASDGSRRMKVAALCLTNPDVLQLAINYTRALLEKNPDAYIVSISQDDNVYYCQCDECMAVYEEEGGHFSGTVLRFVNAIARDIAEDYPNAFIETLAYLQTASAPTMTVAEDNVIVRLCHVTGCSSHTIEDRCWGGTIHKYASSLDGTILPLADCLEAWGEICENIYIWEYNTCYHQNSQVYPNFEPLLDNVGYYCNNNVKGIFVDSNELGTTGEFDDLRSYLTAKTFWDPMMTSKEFYTHMDEFLRAVYGPGGGKLREFIDLAEELTEDTCFHWGLDMKMFITSAKQTVDTGAKGLPSDLTLDMIEHYETTDWSPYYQYYEAVVVSCELFDRGRALFAEAMELAETDEQRKAIGQASIQLDLLESYYRDALNTAIKENVQFLCEAYLKENANLTSSKIKSLAAKVGEHVLKAELLPAYGQFNRAVCEKALSFNIRVYGIEKSFAEVKQYEKNPDGWF